MAKNTPFTEVALPSLGRLWRHEPMHFCFISIGDSVYRNAKNVPQKHHEGMTSVIDYHVEQLDIREELTLSLFAH